MPTKFTRSDLQKKYTYTWERDDSDKPYSGIKDRVKIDKDEGYEVLPFLNHFLADYNKSALNDFHDAEDTLQLPSLSSTDMRDELDVAMKNKLGW